MKKLKNFTLPITYLVTTIGFLTFVSPIKAGICSYCGDKHTHNQLCYGKINTFFSSFVKAADSLREDSGSLNFEDIYEPMILILQKANLDEASFRFLIAALRNYPGFKDLGNDIDEVINDFEKIYQGGDGIILTISTPLKHLFEAINPILELNAFEQYNRTIGFLYTLLIVKRKNFSEFCQHFIQKFKNYEIFQNEVLKNLSLKFSDGTPLPTFIEYILWTLDTDLLELILDIIRYLYEIHEGRIDENIFKQPAFILLIKFFTTTQVEDENELNIFKESAQQIFQVKGISKKQVHDIKEIATYLFDINKYTVFAKIFLAMPDCKNSITAILESNDWEIKQVFTYLSMPDFNEFLQPGISIFKEHIENRASITNKGKSILSHLTEGTKCVIFKKHIPICIDKAGFCIKNNTVLISIDGKVYFFENDKGTLLVKQSNHTKQKITIMHHYNAHWCNLSQDKGDRCWCTEDVKTGGVIYNDTDKSTLELIRIKLQKGFKKQAFKSFKDWLLNLPMESLESLSEVFLLLEENPFPHKELILSYYMEALPNKVDCLITEMKRVPLLEFLKREKCSKSVKRVLDALCSNEPISKDHPIWLAFNELKERKQTNPNFLESFKMSILFMKGPFFYYKKKAEEKDTIVPCSENLETLKALFNTDKSIDSCFVDLVLNILQDQETDTEDNFCFLYRLLTPLYEKFLKIQKEKGPSKKPNQGLQKSPAISLTDFNFS